MKNHPLSENGSAGLPEPEELEAYLRATLKPVSPRKVFVDRLGARLQETLHEETEDEGFFQFWTWVAAGVISSVLAVVGVRRYMQRNEPGLDDSTSATVQTIV